MQHGVQLKGLQSRKQAIMTAKVLKTLWPELDVSASSKKSPPKKRKTPTTVKIA